MKKKTESGQIVIILVFGLVAMIGFVALAVDGGQLFSEQRTAQNGADNAAMAGAQALCREESVSAAALATALSNGFDNNGTTNTVTIHHPPASGPYVGDDEYIEVLINSKKETFFAQLVYQGDFEVTTRAVARCRLSFDYAVLALTSRNDVRGLEITGAGDLSVIDGGIMSNSTHPTQSLYVQDAGAVVTAEVIHATGGVSCSGTCDPPPEGGQPYVPDPLASIPPPAVQPQPLQSSPTSSDPCTTAGGHPGLAVNQQGNRTVTLNPGMYCYIQGGNSIDYVLNPGIYYIDGQNSGAYGIQLTGDSTLSTVPGTGVMIYLSTNAGRVYMYGNADIDISACRSTDPGAWCVGSLAVYSGMLFYADRSYTRTISMIGNAHWDAIGTIYAAGSALDLSGNGVDNNLSSMIVANTIRLGGSSNTVVNYDPGLNVTPPTTVSLVE